MCNPIRMKWLLALGAVQRQENLSARLLLLFPAQLETIKDISLDAAPKYNII